MSKEPTVPGQPQVSGWAHGAPVSRRERQVEELRALCECGSLRRAVDLAFLHFADFGRSDEVIGFIAEAIERTATPVAVRRRFLDLRSSRP
jgi:hypothetical protein